MKRALKSVSSKAVMSRRQQRLMNRRATRFGVFAAGAAAAFGGVAVTFSTAQAATLTWVGNVVDPSSGGGAGSYTANPNPSPVMVDPLPANPYRWTTDLQPLGDIANVEHMVPRDWISEDGFLPNEKFIEYARPLIEGEVKVPVEGGLPKYVTLEKVRVEKKLPPRA